MIRYSLGLVIGLLFLTSSTLFAAEEVKSVTVETGDADPVPETPSVETAGDIVEREESNTNTWGNAQPRSATPETAEIEETAEPVSDVVSSMVATPVVEPAPVKGTPVNKPDSSSEKMTFSKSPKPAALSPGWNFGMAAHLSALGSMRLKFETESDSIHFGMANTPGFDLFLEKITAGRSFAPGIGISVDFPVLGYWEFETFALGVLFQIDYKMRTYFSLEGLVRPYFQGAVGIAFGAASSLLRNDYPIAIGVDGGAGIGMAFVPKKSRAAFFCDIGLKYIQWWAPGTSRSNPSAPNLNSDYYYYNNSRSSDRELASGGLRTIVLSVGLEI